MIATDQTSTTAEPATVPFRRLRTHACGLVLAFTVVLSLQTTSSAQARRTLTFSNQSSSTVRVYWINGSKETLYHTLAPGKSARQETGDRHRWVIRDAGTNRALRYVTAVRNETISITSPAGSRNVRPFYIIGHHANTIAKFNEHVRNGANMIEMDTHMYTKTLTFSGSDKIYLMHFAADEFTRKFTNSDGIAAYFRNVKAKLDSGQVQGIILDVKNTLVSDGPIHYSSSYPDPRKYGRVLAETMKRYRIPADRVIMGFDKAATARPKWGEEFKKGVLWDAKYNCLLNLYVSESNASKRAATISAASDVGEIGLDEKVRGKFSGYRGDLQAMVGNRDRKSGELRFVYFWTVNNKADMRSALDLGIDGMITDHPATLKSVLNEPKYRAKFRLAGRNDYPVPANQRVKRSTNDPYIYVTLNHGGGYVAKFDVSWTVNGKAKSYSSGNKTLGWYVKLSIPRQAKNVRVHAQAKVFIGTWRDIYKGALRSGSYTAYGTTLNRKWKRN